jgi:hypothetical protein
VSKANIFWLLFLLFLAILNRLRFRLLLLLLQVLGCLGAKHRYEFRLLVLPGLKWILLFLDTTQSNIVKINVNIYVLGLILGWVSASEQTIWGGLEEIVHPDALENAGSLIDLACLINTLHTGRLGIRRVPSHVDAVEVVSENRVAICQIVMAVAQVGIVEHLVVEVI